ncbi:MAG: hypothetical protein AAF108_05395 [Planctomycetota bacterium]
MPPDRPSRKPDPAARPAAQPAARSAPQPDRQASSPVSDRADRLEESVAFLDHRLDQLDAAIRGLGELLDAVRARVEHVETAMAENAAEARSAAEPGGTAADDLIDDVPPHAARAPYDRPDRAPSSSSDQE